MALIIDKIQRKFRILKKILKRKKKRVCYVMLDIKRKKLKFKDFLNEHTIRKLEMIINI